MSERKQREELEQQVLAPFACTSAETLGRVYPEKPHAYRTDFQRDRDRVIHSKAFRRLEYKTQVFINGTADHYRTRLTHTMEMAAVARTLARALRVNEDLAEAISLAHDIGHSPFGHCGERELNTLMEEHGGFDHNIQSCRAVERLEFRYPDYPGLNLTWEVRAGLRKHLAKEPGELLDGRPIGPFQSLEAQIADVADDATYLSHDVDDGLDAGLLDPDKLAGQELWKMAQAHARTIHPNLTSEHEMIMGVRALLDLQVKDLLEHSKQLLQKHTPASLGDVMNAPERLVCFSPEMAELFDPFKSFLFKEVYWHPRVEDENRASVEMMRKLFLYYIDHPESMGSKARRRIEQEGLYRTACDYVSGMTDRYAIEEYLEFELDKN